MGLRQGGGYLLEDLPEVFEQGPKSRAVDDLMVDARGPQLSEVASLLSKTAESPSVLTRLALQLLRYAELGRWSAHADRIALFGLAAAAATCVRDKPMLDGMSVPDLLGLLSADILHLPGEESLVAETYARLEDRHLPLLEKELDQARVSSGLTRLVLLVRRLRQPRLAASLVPLLSRKTAPDAASSAAGGLVELGPVVLPELERAYESMDFEGKALALDIMGFLDCPESGACLGRRVRGALADTELLDRWALSASWLGHQDLKTTARRWAACAPWPLQALADL